MRIRMTAPFPKRRFASPPRSYRGPAAEDTKKPVSFIPHCPFNPLHGTLKVRGRLRFWGMIMRIGLALVAALALAAPARAQVKEGKEIAEIGGRSLYDWIKDINHKDPSKRETAARAVLAFPPERAYEAVPAMLTELRRATAVDTSVRVNLAIALGQILGAKKDADPKLVKDAVTLLTRLLSDTQGIVKYQAAKALASIGPPEARAALNELLPLLRDKSNYELRQAGALALAQIVIDPQIAAAPWVHKQLQDLLNDPAYGVRQAACQALNKIGHPVEAAQKAAILKTLETLSKKDPEPPVQIWASVAAMSYSGKIGAEQLEVITRLLHSGDANTKVQAAQALGTIGRRAKEVVPALIEVLKEKDNDPNVVGFTIIALGHIESVRAIPALENLALESTNEAIKKAAMASVEQIKKASAGGK